MKRFTTLLLSSLFMTLATPGYSASIVEYPWYIKWYKQQVAATKATFECIVPEEERSQWRFYDHYCIIPKPVGDIGEPVESFWIPPNDSNFLIFNGEDRNWPNRIVIRFMPIKFLDEHSGTDKLEKLEKFIDRMYAGMSLKIYNKKIIKGNDNTISIDIERLENERNDTFLVYQKQVKEIALFSISNDRIISLSYELRPEYLPKLAETWDKVKDLWLQRFQDIQFD